MVCKGLVSIILSRHFKWKFVSFDVVILLMYKLNYYKLSVPVNRDIWSSKNLTLNSILIGSKDVMFQTLRNQVKFGHNVLQLIWWTPQVSNYNFTCKIQEINEKILRPLQKSSTNAKLLNYVVVFDEKIAMICLIFKELY